MAKRRFRIEGGRYGGEAVLGSVNPAFADYYAGGDEYDIVEAVQNADDWSNYDEQDETGDELLDPEGPPSPSTDEDGYFNMWENDEFEHINSSYTDGGFFVYEVPADGSEDYAYENEVGEFAGICVYSREGALFGDEHPGVEVNEEDEEGNKYVPVLLFHSGEKGTFTTWFVETDGEDFDQYKLGYGSVETNVGEFIDRVYYDKVELEENYDYCDSTGKGYYASVGWLNTKWHDSHDKYSEDNLDPIYWQDFDDNVEYERENG